MTDTQMKTEILSSGFGLITNPEMVKIKTIKKKYVEQLPKFNFRIDDLDTGRLVILGDYLNSKIIVRDEITGHVGWISWFMVQKKLDAQAKAEENPDADKWVIDQLDKIPQMFAD